LIHEGTRRSTKYRKGKTRRTYRKGAKGAKKREERSRKEIHRLRGLKGFPTDEPLVLTLSSALCDLCAFAVNLSF
jgi:hypothetical protein